jgi:hypothetical protein
MSGPAGVALIAIALAASSALAQSAAQSGDGFSGPSEARPKHKPVNLELEAPSRYLLQDLTKDLNELHDRYRRFKKKLPQDYGLHPGSGPAAVFTVRTTAFFRPDPDGKNDVPAKNRIS